MFNQIIPKKLDDFILNKKVAERLIKYNSRNFLNTIVHGSKFSGKKTLINSLLIHLFRDENLSNKIQNYNIKINNNDVKITCIQSIYHFEI